MDAMEAIRTRRSIRRYTSEKIPEELVRELVYAGMSAPSAGNSQPWHFVLVDDRKLLDEVPTFHPYSTMLKDAPLAILVCVDLNLGSNEGLLVQDGSAATENILLAAHANGLGAVWLAIYPLKERIAGMRRLLGMPQHVLPLSLVSLGYPAEKRSGEDRYQPSRVHRNRWAFGQD